MKDKCLRCGLCCRKDDGSDCQHLKRLKSGKTKCLIYKTRLTTIIGNGKCCMLRKDSAYDFPNCPYNSGKPIDPLLLN